MILSPLEGDLVSWSSMYWTAAMCLHLHPFPRMWQGHSQVNLSRPYDTLYVFPFTVWDFTSHRLSVRTVIWPPFSYISRPLLSI